MKLYIRICTHATFFFLLSTHATLQLKGWKKCLRDFAIHKETNKRSRALPQWCYFTTTPLGEDDSLVKEDKF